VSRSGAAAKPYKKNLHEIGSQALEDSVFPDEFRRFLRSSVASVDAAELLLSLAAEPQRSWQRADFGADKVGYLAQFEAAGLLQVAPDGRMRFRREDETLSAHVAMLAQAYKERPVTLFRAIYAQNPRRT
jgi:hypothetical protein